MTTRRKVIWGAVAVVACLWLLVPTFTLDRAKARILNSLQQTLGRRVTADSVHLNLFPWPGFELDGVRLGEAPAFGAEDMVSADDVHATLRLMSLWSGRLEFSSIALDDANINLVRNAAGAWNLANLLNRAATATPPLRPTAAPASLRQPVRFPYLELRNGRVNFKFGLVKKAFYLDQVEGSLALEPRAWRMHLRFQPQRTDLNLSDTGEVTVDGHWSRASSRMAFADLPFVLAAHLSNSYLAGSTALWLGHDAGIHGLLGANLSIRGTGRRFEVSGTLGAAALRRWDLLPSALRVAVSFDAFYTPPEDHLQIVQLGEPGHVEITGSLDGALTSPRTDLTATIQDYSAARLIPLAHALDPRLPAGLLAEGSIAGNLQIGGGRGEPWSGSGALEADRIRVWDGNTVLRLTEPVCSLEPGKVFCAERDATITAPAGAATPVTLGLEADRRGLELAVAGPRLTAAAAAALARLGGAPPPWPVFVSGEAQVTLGASWPWRALAGQAPVSADAAGAADAAGWSGQVFWPTVELHFAQLRAPIRLRDLRWNLRPGHVVSAQFTARLGDDTWSGEVTSGKVSSGNVGRAASPGRLAQAQPGAEDPAEWSFHLHAATATATRLAAALRPARPGLLGAVFGAPPSMLSRLAAVPVRGAIDVGNFAWHGYHAGVHATLAAGGGEWRVDSLNLTLAGGHFTGAGEWRNGLLNVQGAAQGIHLAALLAPGSFAQAIAGIANATVELSLPLSTLTDSADLSQMHAQGQVRIVRGIFPVLQWHGGPLPFDQLTGDLTCADNNLLLRHATLRSGDQLYAVTGSLRLTQPLDLVLSRNGQQLRGTLPGPAPESAARAMKPTLPQP